jgi:hypothetical protein
MGEKATLISGTTFTSIENRKFNSKWIGLTLIAFTLVSGIYSSYIAMGYNWVFFSWHPVSMIGSFIALSGNAVLLKKIGGYENTKKHGFLMLAATLMALFAWYVIYTNKKMQGKKHLTSIHGKIGMFVLVGNIAMALSGALGLNPDWGFLRTNKQIRLIHKYSGRIVAATAYISCVLGFMNIETDLQKRLIYGVPLLCLSYYVIL